jgi:hypothetical protein
VCPDRCQSGTAPQDESGRYRFEGMSAIHSHSPTHGKVANQSGTPPEFTGQQSTADEGDMDYATRDEGIILVL